MIDYLNSLLSALDKIQGLSAAALICFGCIVLGYILRFIKKFPNDGIPVAVILFGSAMMLFLADPRPTAMPARIWSVRNLLVGAIIGFVAWMLHKVVLSKIEEYIAKKFPDLNDTTFFTNKKTAETTETTKTNDETKIP